MSSPLSFDEVCFRLAGFDEPVPAGAGAPGEPGSGSCSHVETLLPDLGYVVGGVSGDTAFALVQVVEQGLIMIADLGMVGSGQGDTWGRLDGIRAFVEGESSQVIVDTRLASGDWDVAERTYGAGESFHRTRCSRDAAGMLTCSTRVVREVWGEFELKVRAPSASGPPYGPGELLHGSDCRAEDLMTLSRP